MKRTFLLPLLVFLFLSLPCLAQRQIGPSLYLGGDVSMLPVYEEARTLYRNGHGRLVSPLRFFKENGWNILRVRLFVDPENASAQHRAEGVCQDYEYVKSLCRRIKKNGYRLMLDLHYSDTWADPGKQQTPRRWSLCPPEALADSVYAYTLSVLRGLQGADAEPDFIQIGNEVSYGMLWPSGKVSVESDEGWSVFVSYLLAGIRACREQCPKAKIIIHTERGGEAETTIRYYERLQEHVVDYDIIGLSYYPMWHGRLASLGSTLYRLDERFPAKDVMIVETAFYYSHEHDPWVNDHTQYADTYPVSTEGQRLFTLDLVNELQSHRNVTGLLWWFPEENAYRNDVSDRWLNRGLFDNRTGKALPALSELRKFLRKR